MTARAALVALAALAVLAGITWLALDIARTATP